MDRNLFAREHGGRFSFEIDEGFAAHVDGHPVQRASGECPWAGARVVAGDGSATVAAHVETFAADGELAWLGLDVAFTDLLVAVVQRERALRDLLRLFTRLVETRRQQDVLAHREFLRGDDLL